MPTQQQIDDAIATLSQVRPPYLKSYDAFLPGIDFVQYSGQWWDGEEIEAALNTFIKGNWITAGDEVANFQDAFAKKYNVKYAQMVNSGSSANLVMIAALKKHLGWKDGDEIIVSPVGFPTTIAPLVQNNLKPVFIDIELDTLNFDVTLIEQKITPRTKAIFVSPVLGNPPDMDFIAALCAKHDILLIGDNCDSLGTTVYGESITKYYYSWTCSFYPAHHISTGEGGMVCSDDEELIKTARSISWWGRDCYCVGAANVLSCGTCGKRFDSWLDNYDGIIDHKYLFTNMGYNLKPLDLQGAIGLAQIRKVDKIDVLRRQYKDTLDTFLEKKDGIRTIKASPGSSPSWFGTPVYCETPELKEFFVAHLEGNLIQTRNYFSGNILMHPGYKHLDDFNNYPNSNCALSNVFFLGCSPLWTDEVVKYIGKVIEEF
jgi:CDP-6-deoxy-D-xylo-4-hexulose-3-dehydrase